MSPTRLLLAPALLLLLTPLAGAHGPYHGQVRQGEADLYVEDHSGPICGDAFTRWTVTLTYAPASDTLTLVVPGSGVSVGKNGVAAVSFTTSTTCAFFEIVVQGTLVRSVADHTVTVTTGPGTPGGLGKLLGDGAA